ncbi:phosphate propanoyltransferase [Aquibacillus halophilus]|uniref:Phosphate propanoyltransferase n=1 Tax=Aquibacillus halophilus TaxID=930132 RepID=A0A6A8DAR5_9BACI|nr:phosphate propanoyltransferase [Aquibacillus halophilus]MRH41656.1 phosphate propanoyltransferase [Aquibacillus halophilus]
MDQRELTQIIESTVKEVLSNHSTNGNEVPIAVSNRHAHLSRTALQRLFGQGYELKKLKDLSQPGQFAARETVTVIGPKGKLKNVRVLGPTRGETQIEVSLTDAHTIGLQPPIRNSGDIEGSPPIILQGPKGQLKLDKGLICAARHIHMHTRDAVTFGVSDGDVVGVVVEGPRAITFENTLIRVSPNYQLEMHVDFDEANAANLKSGAIGTLKRSVTKQ